MRVPPRLCAGVPSAHGQPFANGKALFIIRPNVQVAAGPDADLQTFGNPVGNYTWVRLLWWCSLQGCRAAGLCTCRTARCRVQSCLCAHARLQAAPAPHVAHRMCLQNGTAQGYDYNTLYDFETNVRPRSRCCGVHLTLAGPAHPICVPQTFEPVYIHELAFCGGNTLLPDGRAFIVGGIIYTALRPLYTWGADAVRIFDPYNQNYTVRGATPAAGQAALRCSPGGHRLTARPRADRAQDVLLEMVRPALLRGTPGAAPNHARPPRRRYPTVMTNTDGTMLILGGNQAVRSLAP